jgi:hypothetical protein
LARSSSELEVTCNVDGNDGGCNEIIGGNPLNKCLNKQVKFCNL